MRWKKATPGEGGEARVEQFSYTRTTAGLKGQWYCWCAHAPVWMRAHEHKDNGRKEDWGTKPCLTWFTDGALACPRCRPGAKVTTVAYCAVWREEDLAPCMVIAHEATADRMQELEFGRYALVSCVEKGAGVVIRAAAEKKRWVSDLPYRQGACDIEVSLLTMWKLPDLEQWLKTPERPKQECAPDAPPRGAKLRGDPMLAAAHRLVDDAINGASGVDDATDRIMRRAGGAKPSANGHHKPDGGAS